MVGQLLTKNCNDDSTRLKARTICCITPKVNPAATIVGAPTIVAAGFTLGVMQQIVRAFSRVESSLQFLVRSWPTIVELISIYKRLQSFELAIRDQSMPEWEVSENR